MHTSGTLLFVGPDLCSREPVLTAFGYQLLHCDCDPLAVFDVLTQSTVDAILFTCDPKPPAALILSAARAASDAPAILFAHNTADYNAEHYDLVLPSLCSPHDWLPALADLIASNRDLQRPKRSRAVAIDAPRRNHKSLPEK